MKPIVVVLLVLLLSACASSQGFDRGELRERVGGDRQVTDKDIQQALETRPQLPEPFKLAVYFQRNWSWGRGYRGSWAWTGDDKARVLALGDELEQRGIVSDVLILSESLVEGDGDNHAIRLAAARTGADAVLIFNGIGSIDRYNNALGATYFLIITPFFVPGTVVDGLFVADAAMWDVTNQFLYLSAQAEDTASETRPAFLAENGRVMSQAKAGAFEALMQEVETRLLNMAAE